MANSHDNIVSTIPDHIIEQYPRFVDFLAAYYEWLCKEDNPYYKIRHHMDQLAFEESIDSYIMLMKDEYLSDMPEAVVMDKELFIKWSRKFNLARGSHASYKLLFNMLYGDDTAEIYVPKDNILKTSDGTWVSGESLIQVTYSPTNQEDFQFQQIRQTIPVYEGIFRQVSATVQLVRTKYTGRYILSELSITNIEGEFDPNFPIISDVGKSEWIIPTASSVNITDAGQFYQIGQRVQIDNLVTYCVIREADINRVFDTRVTTFFRPEDIEVEVNGTIINSTEYDFDGRYLTYTGISIGSTVRVSFPPYQGYMVVDRLTETGGISAIEILDLPVGCPDGLSLITEGLGSGLVGTVNAGTVKPVKGYYRNNRGHLSSNMYLQDSVYYQNYSYVIKTQVDFEKYGDIVKNVLHPAGFLLIGQINIFNLIELILTYKVGEISVPAILGDDTIHKYGLGTNWKFISGLEENLSHRVYPNQFKATLDQDFLYGETGYELESIFLSQLFEYEYKPTKKGWMDKKGYSEFYVYFQQDYYNDIESGKTYIETGYVQ